jgi:hypothetical protein
LDVRRNIDKNSKTEKYENYVKQLQTRSKKLKLQEEYRIADNEVKKNDRRDRRE